MKKQLITFFAGLELRENVRSYISWQLNEYKIDLVSNGEMWQYMNTKIKIDPDFLTKRTIESIGFMKKTKKNRVQFSDANSKLEVTIAII